MVSQQGGVAIPIRPGNARLTDGRRPEGAVKEERRRRSVLDCAAGATIETGCDGKPPPAESNRTYGPTTGRNLALTTHRSLYKSKPKAANHP
jgi:hypothetical protein